MNLSPIVSIITTCYNDGKFLLECIDSVKAQTYPNIEHIIINDGSTDSFTLTVLKEVALDPKITLITTPNQGVCKARNQAVHESNGVFILPLDSDDLISSQFVELAVKEIIQNDNIKLVATNYNFFGRIKRTIIVEKYSIEKLMGHNLFVVSTLFRRQDFVACGGFNTNMKEGLEDWDLWLSIMKTGGEVKCLKGINFFYRIKSKKNSRNIASAVENHQKLRRQLWENHKELYGRNFPNPEEMYEYLKVLNSREYRLGKMILSPIYKLLRLF